MSIRMILRSFDSIDVYPHNEPYDFRVHLETPLTLSGYWTVALTEFTILGHNPGLTSQPELFLCCNICDDNIVGGREIPLLRRIYAERTGNIIFQSTSAVHVSQGQLQDIHLFIRTDKNEQASFLKGQVCVTLVLRRLPFHITG